MKELDDFTVERLEKLIHLDGSGCVVYDSGVVGALARIALAAKTAEPVAEVRLGDYDDDGWHPDAAPHILIDGPDWANFPEGFKLYGAPALNSPELPDGWKLVPIVPTPEMEQAISDGIYNDLYTTGIYADLLAAAPTPPTTEK